MRRRVCDRVLSPIAHRVRLGIRRGFPNKIPGPENGQTVEAAGLVTIRQRPMTAKGILFVTLEDEWGFINLIIGPELFEKSRSVAVSASSMIAKGCVQNHRGIIHIKCLQIETLTLI